MRPVPTRDRRARGNRCVSAILACVHASSLEADRADAASPDALAADLGVLLKLMMGSSNRDLFAAVEQAGVTITQVKCLGILHEAGAPLAVGALSEALGLSVPAVSRAVDALVQRSLVRRTEDPRDRRSKLVTVNAKGRRAYERFAEIRFAGVKRFVAGLTDAEREALAAGVRPLVERLEVSR
jgi:DNA-binding MarR family transcriptional regulator